jgi:hypothetical protein
MNSDIFSLIKEGRRIIHEEKTKPSVLLQQKEAAANKALEAAQRALDRIEWVNTKAIALLTEHTCARCGFVTTVFAGFSVEMRQKSSKDTRIVVTDRVEAHLPREIRRIKTTTRACIACLAQEGFILKENPHGS